MRKVRYAMIGFGGIAEQRLAKEGFALDRARFAPLPEAELVAATDLAPARRGAAEALGLRWHEDCASIFADPGIDAVVIATNNASHAPLAIAAMQAGKHCLVEKPMATAVADAERLVELARARGLSLAVDHMMVHQSHSRKARQLIEAGALGRVNDLCLHMEFLYGATPAEAASWRCARPEELGGPIGDVASHCLYMAEFLAASPIVAVAASYLPPTLPLAVENGAYLRFTLADGLTGSIRVAFCEPRGGLVGTLANLGYEVYGDQAVLRSYATLFQFSGHADEPLKIRLELDNGQRVRRIAGGRPQNIYRAVVREHARSIRTKRPQDGTDAVHNLRLVMAAHDSARHGGKVVQLGA